jgi:hypothetical protein
VIALIGLYPRAWRERYGDEYTELVAALAADDPSLYRQLRLAVDIIGGACDAHLNPALRRGIVDGLAISTVITAMLVLSNVVFPAGPTESDNDPEYLVQIFGAYLILALLLVLTGFRARRRSDTEWAGAVAGAAAGFVMAVVVLVASLVIDNAWLSIVSQQHDKKVAFEASGWTSMRVYLNVRTLIAALVVIPFATFVGGALGAVGGRCWKPGQDSAAPVS